VTRPRTGEPDYPLTADESPEDEAWNQAARGETPLQREDRRYAELLQEVRVAQTGVQILLAFLFSVAFTPRFSDLTTVQRDTYIATLVLGSCSAALLIAPVSNHRLMFGQRLKPELVRVANIVTGGGLILLMLTIAAALLLVVDVTAGPDAAGWITGAVLTWFVFWWYVLPTVIRIRSRR
jgi:Family of unknown function (DUF6328)